MHRDTVLHLGHRENARGTFCQRLRIMSRVASGLMLVAVAVLHLGYAVAFHSAALICSETLRSSFLSLTGPQSISVQRMEGKYSSSLNVQGWLQAPLSHLSYTSTLDLFRYS
jgi:hypothetical protein